MDLRSKKIFFLFLVLIGCTLPACSIYQSSGREIIQKNTNNVVRAGFNIELAAKFECYEAPAQPSVWDELSTSLDEYTTSETFEAKLIQKDELPVVLIAHRQLAAGDFEGCALHILDSKLSSQRLKDVVTYGEKLLTNRETPRP